MFDQAKQLREKIQQQKNLSQNRKPTKIIAVTSGKGGVGKSNFSLNFALSLIQHNKKVLIFDVDLGFANVDVLLGRTPKESIVTMLEKNLSIWDIIEEGPNGLLFITGGSGYTEMIHLGDDHFKKFFSEMSKLQSFVDYIILDTGAGLSDENLRFILSADDVMIVTTPEPTSITDAYALVKMVHAQNQKVHFNLIINQATNEKEGLETAEKFQNVVQQFLNKHIDILGYIPSDYHVSQAVKKQIPFLLSYPNSQCSTALLQLTRKYLQIPSTMKLGIKGFLLKMFSK